MSKAKIALSTAASIAASAMLIRSIANEILPSGIQDYFCSGLHRVSRCMSSQLTIVIEEFKGLSINQVFEAAHLYLGVRTNATSTQRLRVGKTENEKTLEITLDRNEEFFDVYENVKLKWRFVCLQVQAPAAFRNGNMGDYNASLRSEVRQYELSFHKKHKDTVLNVYLPHILEKANAIKKEGNVIKLHTVNYDRWDANDTIFKHPMTFKSLALDAELKKDLIEDLDNFMNGKEYYERIGRSWKRGYLLYGPPGTGKSSLIAAMANHLKFDIYDLDLTDIQSNSDLRVLLLSMPSQSILVIEDIDCSIKLQNRESEDSSKNQSENQRDDKQVTLSGLLNFIDGLWSCCGEKRIIIFTTNHKEKLDPALLRPGRMDMHIPMSYCNTSVFEQLVFNYLGISHHHLLEQIQELIMEVEVTPAEVAGELMKRKCGGADISLQGLSKFLQAKKTEKDKAKN
ncbi:AAA-ATPase At3g50940-like isoform X2 [Pistacia vera]|uniref:AAA-ATPase At3g50940-like isoform X1 n=1 Tax=Pistacia vera TaxID=55513 RepID=UPI001262ED9E|nr:AAA-ATPase At3g50940-like isoform X1 [Pistacia vera]XP_031258304.1 AAA-ATPase At3g50940-like isoform X2 [Pistacia vera]